MRIIRWALAIAVAAVALCPAASMSQDIGGIFNNIMRNAIETQRQQQLRDQQQQQFDLQQQEILLEQRRKDAESRAQQQIDAARLEAHFKAEEGDRLKREDLSKLVPAAKALIEDATSFLKANPSVSKALNFVAQINGLNSALAESDPAKLKNLMQNLAADLRQEPAYPILEDGRLKKERTDAERYLPELIKTAKQEQIFIRYYVTNNPIAPQTNVFIPLI